MMKNKQKVKATFRLKVECSKVLDHGLLWITILQFNNRRNSDIEKRKQKVKVTYRLEAERSKNIRPWYIVPRFNN